MQPSYSAWLRRWIVPFAAGMVMTSVIGVLLYWNSASARTSDVPGLTRRLSGADDFVAPAKCTPRPRRWWSP